MMIVRIVDSETTGTDPAKDRVVEIASIDVDLENRRLTRPLSRLVNPGIPIPPEASAVHHITDRIVADKPSWDEVKAEFAGADIYVAHNAGFDMQFLPLTTASGEPARWICAYKAARRVWHDKAPGFSNQVLRYWLGLEDCVPGHLQSAHRALYDVYCTGAVFLELLKLSRRPTLADALDGMIELSKLPAYMPLCPLKKHKGRPWSEVPTDYLEWICKAEDMGQDIVWRAVRELHARGRTVPGHGGPSEEIEPAHAPPQRPAEPHPSQALPTALQEADGAPLPSPPPDTEQPRLLL